MFGNQVFTEHSPPVLRWLEIARVFHTGSPGVFGTPIPHVTKAWGTVERLERKGTGLRILSLGGDIVDTRSATGKLTLTIFAGFAQFEREMMLERQREGIAKAEAEGRYKDRKPTARAKAEDACRLPAEGKTVTQVVEALGIGRASVYRALAPQ